MKKNIEDKILTHEYIYFKVNFKDLSKILKRADGGNFRKSILKTIKSLSNIAIEYKRNIHQTKNTIQGSSNLLNSVTVINKKGNKYLYLGINLLSWFVLQQARTYYCLLNTEVMFKLPSLPLQWLYHYLCRKVFPGSNYYSKISIDIIVQEMWTTPTNKTVQNLRKTRVRKWCKQLHNLQQHLIDFEIHLIYEDKQGIHYQTINQIYVKRYQIKIGNPFINIQNQYTEHKKELNKQTFFLT